MSALFNLQGKVAIVTGGNGGIGLGIAQGLAGAGSNIVIGARNQAKTEEAVKSLAKEFKIEVLGLQVDVKEEDQVHLMVQRTVEKFGRIDILVNNAGINIRKFPQEYTIKEWDEVFNGQFTERLFMFKGCISGDEKRWRRKDN